MTIVITLFLGCGIGVMLGWLWRAEEMEALQKANARLIEERDNAQNVFRTRQKPNWVS